MVSVAQYAKISPGYLSNFGNLQKGVLGNFITAAGILLIIAFHANDRDMKGVMTELPFFLLSLVILYLQHTLTRN